MSVTGQNCSGRRRASTRYRVAVYAMSLPDIALQRHTLCQYQTAHSAYQSARSRCVGGEGVGTEVCEEVRHDEVRGSGSTIRACQYWCARMHICACQYWWTYANTPIASYPQASTRRIKSKTAHS
eukprot:2197981-Rhodomonas_salina.1